jgi:T5SS/PEP-CTERM-associated repeat protein
VRASDTAEATGQISLSGTNTLLDITGDATVGDEGLASLSVINGATFAAANLTIGAQGPGSGAVFLSDAGSLLDLTGTLNIGIGELTIGPNATVIASKVVLQGEVVNEGGCSTPPRSTSSPARRSSAAAARAASATSSSTTARSRPRAARRPRPRR